MNSIEDDGKGEALEGVAYRISQNVDMIYPEELLNDLIVSFDDNPDIGFKGKKLKSDSDDELPV